MPMEIIKVEVITKIRYDACLAPIKEFPIADVTLRIEKLNSRFAKSWL